MNEHKQIFSQAVLEMFTVANEYCIFIEKAHHYAKEEVYNYLQKVLPLMYLKGSLVPVVDVEYPEANERYVTEEQWQDVFNQLRALIAEDDSFVFCDPGKNELDNEQLSFAENLSDIYQDMKDFVLLFSKEMQAARENAVHEIAQLFKSHWGHRVVMCHVHLHYLLYRQHMENDTDIYF